MKDLIIYLLGHFIFFKILGIIDTSEANSFYHKKNFPKIADPKNSKDKLLQEIRKKWQDQLNDIEKTLRGIWFLYFVIGLYYLYNKYLL